jgi:ribonuclease P protein component
MSTLRFRFPKSSRLYLRKEISELITTGKSLHVSPLKVFYKVLPEGDFPLKMAVTVPKRNFKLAVDRNRIKRQIREAYRLNCHQAIQHFQEKGVTMHIMIVYNSKIPPDYVGLKSKIILILQRLQEVHERNSG